MCFSVLASHVLADLCARHPITLLTLLTLLTVLTLHSLSPSTPSTNWTDQHSQRFSAPNQLRSSPHSASAWLKTQHPSLHAHCAR